MTEGSHTSRITRNWHEHRCAPGDVRRYDSLDPAGQRIGAVRIVWNGGTEAWCIYHHASAGMQEGAFLRGIRFCPFCGEELPSPPQPPRVVSGSWQEWDEVREAIAYAESRGHQPPALIGKIMTAADWSQQPEPPRAEEDRQAWLTRVTS